MKIKATVTFLFILVTITTPLHICSANEVVVSNKGSFNVESTDKKFHYHLGGRLYVDAALHNDDKSDLVDGTEFRAAEIYFDGTLFENWGFALGLDFSDNTALNKYTYLSYTGFEKISLQLGSADETWGLENWTSNRFITFIERAVPNSICLCDFRIGFTFFTNGDNWSVASDIKGEGVGSNASDDEGYGLSGRVTYAPFHADRGAVHLGLSGIYRKPGDGVSTTSAGSRPESHITTAVVDTGTISNVSHMSAIALEFAGVFGPFSVQSEYIRQDIYRDSNLRNYTFDGYYAYVSWFLTGESRNYEANWGGFGRITPKKMFGDGGTGAVEAALRYSSLDLNDGDITGGRLNSITLGLNWYLNRNVRFMANYIFADTDNNAVTPDDNPGIFLFRAQIEF